KRQREILPSLALPARMFIKSKSVDSRRTPNRFLSCLIRFSTNPHFLAFLFPRDLSSLFGQNITHAAQSTGIAEKTRRPYHAHNGRQPPAQAPYHPQAQGQAGEHEH